MRLLHTSDWHLGRMLHERSLLEDQRVFLGRLLALLRSDPHDALLVAGDVFDRAIAPEAAIDVFGGFLRDLRRVAPSMPVVVIAGNHDSGSRLAYASELLEGVAIHVRGDVDALERPVTVRDAEGLECEVFCLPFLWPGMLAAHGEHEEIPLATQEAALAEATARVRVARTEGRLAVVVAHCFVVGGSGSESERTLLGQAAQVAPSVFEGFDYVALGHLHRPQRVAERIRYSGSPLPYSFSEVHDRKVLLSVTLRPNRLPEVVEIPIAPARRMSVLRGSLTELLEGPRGLAYADDYLHVQLTETDPGASPFTLLRSRYPHLLSLEVVRETAPSAGPSDAVSFLAAPERQDPERDFEAFERHLLGGGEVDPEVQRAFRTVRIAAETPR